MYLLNIEHHWEGREKIPAKATETTYNDIFERYHMVGEGAEEHNNTRTRPHTLEHCQMVGEGAGEHQNTSTFPRQGG